jgi:hypothetical protein
MSSVKEPPKIPPVPATGSINILPPKLSQTSGGLGRFVGRALLVVGVCFLFLIVLIVGLGLLNRAHQRISSGGAVFRKDNVGDYVYLCEILLDKTKLAGAVLPSDAETEIATQNYMAEISRICQNDKKLALIAQGVISLENMRAQAVNNAPNGKALASDVIDAYAGYSSSNNEAMWSGLRETLPDLVSALKFFEAETDYTDKRHQLAIVLAKLAPDFSGPKTNSAMLNVSFAEHQPGFFQVETTQTLTLINSSDIDLHNCVIFERPSNPDGNSYLNVHFAADWPKGGKLEIRHVDTETPKPMIDNTTRVDVSVWTSEFTFEPVTLQKPADGWLEPE